MHPGRRTAEQVHDVAFAKPPIGMRGYNEDEVDRFLEVVAAQMQSGPGAPPTGRSHARDLMLRRRDGGATDAS
jgi:DivIVA domain-containing protein